MLDSHRPFICSVVHGVFEILFDLSNITNGYKGLSVACMIFYFGHRELLERFIIRCLENLFKGETLRMLDDLFEGETLNIRLS
jgi:hypothetical protein